MNTNALRKLLVASASTLSLGIAVFVLHQTEITLAKWSGLLWFLVMGIYLFANPTTIHLSPEHHPYGRRLHSRLNVFLPGPAEHAKR